MNTPAFDPDDPRLTAYALGESSPAEREAVERFLASSPEARTEVERTAALANNLEEEYRRENADYWEARAAEPPSGKIVEFPFSRRVGSKWTVALTWKLAAVLVALGSLAPFVLRNAPLSQTATRDASHPREANSPSPAAAPPATEPASTVGSVAQMDVTRDQMSATPTQPGAEPAKHDADALLAANDDRVRQEAAASADAASRQAAAPTDRADAAKPSARGSAAATAPQAVAPGAPKSASGGRMSAPTDRIRGSLVGIRMADGSLVGGVAVTPGGGILAAQPLPAGERPPTVILEDGRQIAAALTRDPIGFERRRLQVEGATLPAVALATKTPADNGTVNVEATDKHTGATRSIRAKAIASGSEVRLRWTDQPPTESETSLVFTSAGELLNPVTAAPLDKNASRYKSATSHAKETGPILRPFTPAERASLQSESGSGPR